VALVIFLFWLGPPRKYVEKKFRRQQLADLDALTSLDTQTRRDSWDAVRQLVHDYIKKTSGRFSLGTVKYDYTTVRRVYNSGSQEVREALNELANMRQNGQPTSEKDPPD
jgi:hypothetical protein